MTLLEMIRSVELEFQKIDSSSRDAFLPQEITEYLNIAQVEFIKDRFKGGNEPGFEDTTYRIADLQEVVTEAILLPVLEAEDVFLGSKHEYLLPYPENFMFFVGTEVNISRTGIKPIFTNQYIPVTGITHAEIPFCRVTAFNKPYIRSPRLLFREKFMHIFCDADTTMTEGRVVYVANPDKMVYDSVDTSRNVNCELSDHTHGDIVNIAIKLMSASLVSDPTVRTQLEAEGA